jgi:hypothetical protein
MEDVVEYGRTLTLSKFLTINSHVRQKVKPVVPVETSPYTLPPIFSPCSLSSLVLENYRRDNDNHATELVENNSSISILLPCHDE